MKDFVNKAPLLFWGSLVTPFILSSFVTAVAYQLFFNCAAFIWSLNATLPTREFLPDFRYFMEGSRNGMQVYVLYGLTHIIVGTTFFLYCFINKTSVPALRLGFPLLFALPAWLFIKKVGFIPPMAEYSLISICSISGISFIASVLGLTVTLSFLIVKPRSLAITVAILLFPVCAVPPSAYSMANYEFILFPAMRILHGFPLNQTGFQYDALLSLLAAFWMKLGFSVYSFNIMGQISVYAFFVGLYLFGSRFFTQKCYALYWLISAVLVRMYGNVGDIAREFQVTPLRLDWWLVVLVAFFYKGASHWLMGLVLGFLLMFHHAFGVIYALAYGLFLLFQFGMDVLSRKDSMAQVFRSYVILYARNCFFIGIALLFYYSFFAYGPESSSVYRLYGIGFIPISRQSFFWYVPVVLSIVFILNWRNRPVLSEQHFLSGLFLILLAIGNSLYFFGRSHENNLVNISSILLFCLFLLFDLVHSEWERRSHSRTSCWLLPALAIVFIVSISCVYSGRASERVGQQVESFRAHKADGRDRALESFLREHTALIKKITRFSPKVIFVSKLGSYYCYEGGYVPESSYVVASRMIMKDLVDFLNAHLADGYYIVMPMHDLYSFGEVMENLRARNKMVYPSVSIFSNNEIG